MAQGQQFNRLMEVRMIRKIWFLVLVLICTTAPAWARGGGGGGGHASAGGHGFSGGHAVSEGHSVAHSAEAESAHVVPHAEEEAHPAGVNPALLAHPQSHQSSPTPDEGCSGSSGLWIGVLVAFVVLAMVAIAI